MLPSPTPLIAVWYGVAMLATLIGTCQQASYRPADSRTPNIIATFPDHNQFGGGYRVWGGWVITSSEGVIRYGRIGYNLFEGGYGVWGGMGHNQFEGGYRVWGG